MSQGFDTKSADVQKSFRTDIKTTEVASIAAIQQSIVGHFSGIKDPRVERTKKHQLPKMPVAFVLSTVPEILPFYDALLWMLKGREQTYKRSLRQKMKRTAMDDNYMILVLSCCFIDNTLDSSESLCQA